MELPPELTDRLARGQVFNTGRDYFSAGLRTELTPLLQLTPLLIFNLNDQSSLFFLQGTYSLGQDLGVDFGGTLGLGSKGTEFGGIETSPGSTVYLEPLNQLYIRLTHYF